MHKLNYFARPIAFGIVLAALSTFAVTGASANEFSSSYTELNLDDCTTISDADLGLSASEGDGARYACLGFANSLVYVAEGDLRMFVSYGLGALQEQAASQTLPSFNTINTTLEWRLSDQTGEWLPFATILRWYTQSGDSQSPDGEMLIVTKLEPGNVCHVAYIDAKTTANANEVARQFADSAVADFDCATDEVLTVAG